MTLAISKLFCFWDQFLSKAFYGSLALGPPEAVVLVVISSSNLFRSMTASSVDKMPCPPAPKGGVQHSCVESFLFAQRPQLSLRTPAVMPLVASTAEPYTTS